MWYFVSSGWMRNKVAAAVDPPDEHQPSQQHPLHQYRRGCNIACSLWACTCLHKAGDIFDSAGHSPRVLGDDNRQKVASAVTRKFITLGPIEPFEQNRHPTCSQGRNFKFEACRIHTSGGGDRSLEEALGGGFRESQ